MDRAIYTSMAGARQAMMAQQVNTNNLANADTDGFKADLFYFKSLYLKGTGLRDRGYDVVQGDGIDLHSGDLNTTGRAMDIALDGNAWLAVNMPDGTEAYTHSASLHSNRNGVLVTQQGFVVRSEKGYAITIAQGDQVSIDQHGGINITYDGQTAVIDALKIVRLPQDRLHRGSYGLMQVDEGAVSSISPAKGGVRHGVLEKSNVSPISCLVNMINIARQYEMDINVMSTVRADDKSSNLLLSVR